MTKRVANPQPGGRPTAASKVERLMAEGGPLAVIASLTPRQIKFVEAYVEDFDKDKALVVAGYNLANKSSSNKMASELVAHPAVKVAISYYVEKRVDKSALSVEYVEHRLMKLAAAMEEAAMKGDTKSAAVMLRTIEVMGKLLGMFVDRQEITGKDGEAIKIEETHDAADAFTRSIARLNERNGEGDVSRVPLD